MITYRRIKDDSVWHLCADCENWPGENYHEIVSDDSLPIGPFCGLCIHKRIEELRGRIQLAIALGECRKVPPSTSN